MMAGHQTGLREPLSILQQGIARAPRAQPPVEHASLDQADTWTESWFGEALTQANGTGDTLPFRRVARTRRRPAPARSQPMVSRAGSHEPRQAVRPRAGSSTTSPGIRRVRTSAGATTHSRARPPLAPAPPAPRIETLAPRMPPSPPRPGGVMWIPQVSKSPWTSSGWARNGIARTGELDAVVSVQSLSAQSARLPSVVREPRWLMGTDDRSARGPTARWQMATAALAVAAVSGLVAGHWPAISGPAPKTAETLPITARVAPPAELTSAGEILAADGAVALDPDLQAVAAPLAGAADASRLTGQAAPGLTPPPPAPPPEPSPAAVPDLAAGQWVLPVAGYHLTARFGETGLWATHHTGLDFAAPSGTPIKAVANGVVTSISNDGAYGNKTEVTLDDGTELWFAHQSSIAVSSGQSVQAGDVIGTVGATGHVTGPHLHLEVRPGGGEPVDPEAALSDHGLAP